MSKALFWFRQDLRLTDNPGLYEACKNHDELLCIYIIDEPLVELQKKAQSWWLYHSLKNLGKTQIKLIIQIGIAKEILLAHCQKHQIDAVYWNRCYEPRAIQRDKNIKETLKAKGIHVQSFNARCLLEPWEVFNQQGNPFKVFTPYWKQCLKQISLQDELRIQNWPQPIESASIQLDDLKLLPTTPNWAIAFNDRWQPGENGAQNRLNVFIDKHLHHYKDARDEPAIQATSGLSPHLHFGEIGPSQIMRTIMNYQIHHPEHHAQTEHFISELGWREFSCYLLYHFPTLPTNNFRPEFDKFPWHQDHIAFKKWTQGQTGYPIVDAGMRELWKTGTMHNRVRMIVASFLVKDLLIDWREGAKWFDETLLDADIASNYASWQWVAGSGADAAPYFRIFNPVLQGEKFDAQGNYVRKWIPEIASLPNKYLHQPWNAPQEFMQNIQYPKPLVDHNQAREQALRYYQALKDQ